MARETAPEWHRLLKNGMRNGMNPSATLLRRTAVLLATLAAVAFLHLGPPPDAEGIGAPAAAAESRQALRVARKAPQKAEESRPSEEGGQKSTGRQTPAPAAGGAGKTPPQAPPKPFVPSEKIRPGQAVDFPTDI